MFNYIKLYKISFIFKKNLYCLKNQTDATFYMGEIELTILKMSCMQMNGWGADATELSQLMLINQLILRTQCTCKLCFIKDLFCTDFYNHRCELK